MIMLVALISQLTLVRTRLNTSVVSSCVILSTSGVVHMFLFNIHDNGERGNER